MKKFVIARRYAKALLLIGKEDGQAEKYGQELLEFSNLFINLAELEQVVCNPVYDTAVRRALLDKIIEKLNPSMIVKEFLFLLFDKSRINFIIAINEFYQKLVDELKGIVKVVVISPTELLDENIEKIRLSLEKKTGKKVMLETKQDSAIIGGIICKIGDTILDGSIKTQLLNMKESLKRS